MSRSALITSVSAIAIIAMASNIASADEAARIDALQEQIDNLQQELEKVRNKQWRRGCGGR